MLPDDINPEAINANLSDGLLTVTVAKSETAIPGRIDIKA